MVSKRAKRTFAAFLAITSLCLLAMTGVFLSGVALPSSDHSNVLLADIDAARHSRGSANVTEAVQRHIKTGDHIDEVIHLLEEAGFKVAKRGAGGMYYAERINKQYPMGYDAYEITFYAPNNIVAEVQIAWAVYRGP